jgi:hypothetical protein
MLVRPDCLWRVIKKHISSHSPCDQWVNKAISVEKVHYNVNIILSQKNDPSDSLFCIYTLSLIVKLSSKNIITCLAEVLH